jgi:hypothetical protein
MHVAPLETHRIATHKNTIPCQRSKVVLEWDGLLPFLLKLPCGIAWQGMPRVFDGRRGVARSFGSDKFAILQCTKGLEGNLALP